MATTRKVLVLATSIGAGHIRAAEAIKDAAQHFDNCEIKIVDYLRYLSPALSKATEEAYYAATKHIPRAYKFLYDLEDRPASRIKTLQAKLGSSKMFKLLVEEKPAAVISTHFMPAGAVDQLPYRGPKTVVLTDYVAHPIWLYHNTDLFFVAHEGMRDYLLKSGIPDSKIRVSGIPIKSEFSKPYDQKEIRKELGLDPELPMIMVTSGGHGIGPMKKIIMEIGKLRQPSQVVAICGNNEPLKEELTELVAEERFPVPIIVKGFVSDIHCWMAAADLLVSKAGGLTVSEALTVGLPMLVIRPTPGQEDGNTDFLLEQGAGIYVQDTKRLPLVISGLLRAPGRIRSMAEAAKKAAKPDAAFNVIEAVNKLCGD